MIKNLRQFVQATIENQGATFNVNNGTSPTSGTAVAIKGHESKVDINPDDVERSLSSAVSGYIIDNGSKLAEGYHVGSWLDKDTNELFLDVVDIIHNPETAVRFGYQNKQKAIYSLDINQEFRLGALYPQRGGTETQKRASIEAVIIQHVREYEALHKNI